MQHRKVVIKSEEERLVYAEVYSPLHVDTDQEAMTQDEIRKMAHQFLASGRVAKIDIQHNKRESGCVVVESFIARKGDPDGFIEGSWVAGIYVAPDQAWADVKSGELNGLSFFGGAKHRSVKARVSVAKRLEGWTEKSMSSGGLLPEHHHSLALVFSDNGRIVPGETGVTLGHVHCVNRATATEKAMEHSHRLVLMAT